MTATPTITRPEATAPTARPRASERRRGWPSWLALLGFVAISQAAGLVGMPFTERSPGGWYDRLDKPPFTPPGATFGIVWTVLYTVMGVAAWLVWRHRPSSARTAALGLFAVQLVLNAAWSPIFFGAEAAGWALVEIVALLVAVAATTAAFWRVEGRAGALFVPYLGWVCFATVLNASIVALN
jgi:tryptophan-rich sensory protein